MGLGTFFKGGYETTPGTSGWGPVADGGTYGRNLSRQKWDNFGNNFTSAFSALNKANGWKNQRQEQQGYGPWAQGGGGGFGGGGTKIGSGATLWQPPGPGGYQILHAGQPGGGGGSGGGGGGGGVGGAISGAASGFLAGGPVGAVVGGIGGLFCDERLKVDIAPLESTEVNDALAEVAFFVKGLRECA